MTSAERRSTEALAFGLLFMSPLGDDVQSKKYFLYGYYSYRSTQQVCVRTRHPHSLTHAIIAPRRRSITKKWVDYSNE